MSTHERSERAISEIVSVTLILILVITLAVIAGAYIFSIVKPVQKTGYLVPKAEMIEPSGAHVIRFQHNGGDLFFLNTTRAGTGGFGLGMYIEVNNTQSRVGLAPSLGQENFRPGDRLFIYASGTGYLATDNLSAVPGSGSLPSGTITLVLTDESSHALLARILLSNGDAVNTPTPTPTPTPVPVGNVYLNAAKGGALQPGGTLEFQVTGLYSSVILNGAANSLAVGDTVKLVTGSDGYGNLYATSSTINTFSFDDVSLYVNGAYRGRGTINSIWISGYGSQKSTLSLKVPSASAWTNLRVDGTTLINGVDASPISVTGLRAPMNMAATSGTIYYDGAASGYSLS